VFVTFALSLVLASANLAQAPSATVRVPVANVWEAPNAGHLPLDPHLWPTPAITYAQRIALVGHMPTQVLYGERVRVLGKRGGWTHIAVPDQPSPLDARGYPGWVRSWQLGPNATWRRTEEIQGREGTCDTHEELKARALVAATVAAAPHRPRAGSGSLDPRA